MNLNLKVLIIGLAIVALWPLLLTPRSYRFDPGLILDDRPFGLVDCYYLSWMGDSLTTGCPPKGPQKQPELHAGQRVRFSQRQFEDRVASEILLPIEFLLILGTVLLARALRPDEESAPAEPGSPLGLKDL